MTKRRTVLFISHSSADSDRALQLCRAIEGPDAAPTGVRTTFDLRDLRGGEAWKPQLYRWMARCDAGLVLLTANVLKNPGWVLQEATLLRARSIFEEGFKLFLVVDDAVRDADWGLFKPLALPELQYSSDDKVAAEVLDRLGPDHAADAAGDYFRRFCSLVTDLLAPFASYPGLVEHLHQKLDLADPRWERIVGRDAALGHALASRLVEFEPGSTAIGAFEQGLAQLFEALRGFGNADQRRGLLNAVRSYWISLGAAPAVARTLELPAGRRLCVLRTVRANNLPPMYFDRFLLPYRRQPHLLRLTGANESVETLAAELVASYNLLPGNEGAELDRADVADDMNRIGTWVVVVLPRMSSPAIARRLAAEFAAALFVLPVAYELALDPAEWDGFERIEPVRGAELEKTIDAQYRSALTHAG